MKAYTDIEQSKKLADILSIDSSDHHYVRKVTDFMGNPVDGEWSHPKYGNPNSKYANYMVQNFTSYEVIPCWSLAALLEIIPEVLVERRTPDGWDCVSYAECQMTSANNFENLIDACVEVILKLHEEKLL